LKGLLFEKGGELIVFIGKIRFASGKYAVTPGKLMVEGFSEGTQFGRC